MPRAPHRRLSAYCRDDIEQFLIDTLTQQSRKQSLETVVVADAQEISLRERCGGRRSESIGSNFRGVIEAQFCGPALDARPAR